MAVEGGSPLGLAPSKFRVSGLCKSSFWSFSTCALVVALISMHWQDRGTCAPPIPSPQSHDAMLISVPRFWCVFWAFLFWSFCFGVSVLALLFWCFCFGTSVLVFLFWYCFGQQTRVPTRIPAPSPASRPLTLPSLPPPARAWQGLPQLPTSRARTASPRSVNIHKAIDQKNIHKAIEAAPCFPAPSLDLLPLPKYDPQPLLDFKITTTCWQGRRWRPPARTLLRGLHVYCLYVSCTYRAWETGMQAKIVPNTVYSSAKRPTVGTSRASRILVLRTGSHVPLIRPLSHRSVGGVQANLVAGIASN